MSGGSSMGGYGGGIPQQNPMQVNNLQPMQLYQQFRQMQNYQQPMSQMPQQPAQQQIAQSPVSGGFGMSRSAGQPSAQKLPGNSNMGAK